jgi:hypothetical protein
VDGPSYQQQRTVPRILVQPSIVRPHPSNMPLMALDRAPSEVTRSVCLQSPTSPCPLVPSFFSPAVFRIRSCRMLNRSSDDPIRRSHVGRYRLFSSQISPDPRTIPPLSKSVLDAPLCATAFRIALSSLAESNRGLGYVLEVMVPRSQISGSCVI